MDDSQLSSLLEASRSDENGAFNALYDALKTPLYTVLLRMTRDRAMSEDLLQEVFLRLYRTPLPPHLRNPRAYIFQMARNLAIDGMRKRHPETSLEDWDGPADAPDVASQVDAARAMDALPFSERQIVALHVHGGLKFREIGTLLSMPLGTVLWKYQKALDRLRVSLSEGREF